MSGWNVYLICESLTKQRQYIFNLSTILNPNKSRNFLGGRSCLQHKQILTHFVYSGLIDCDMIYCQIQLLQIEQRRIDKTE